MSDSFDPADLAGVQRLVGITEAVVRESLDVARRRTDGGKEIDAEQVHCERLPSAATEVAAAKELLAYAQAATAAGQGDPHLNEMSAVFSGEVALRLRAQVEAHPDAFGLDDERLDATLGGAQAKAAMRSFVDDARVRAVGRQVMQQRGANHS